MAVNCTFLSNCTLYGDLNYSNPDMLDETLYGDQTLVQFRNSSRFVIQRVMVPLITIVGVIFNNVTIFIMTRKRMRSSTNLYLAALAIMDMLYLIFIFVLSVGHYPDARNMEFYVYWKCWPFALMLADACSNSSVWLTVTFTFERFIAVNYPIRGKVLCTETRAKKAIFVVSFVCVTFTLPTPFEWTIIEDTDIATNITRLMPIPSELGNNNLYKSVYYWLTAVLFIFIPLVLLTVFNSFLIRSVHLSRKVRKSMTGRRDVAGISSNQENKITVMLIAVVMLFLICQLPTALILLYNAFKHVEPSSNEDNLLRGLGNIFNFLVAINAAGNFVLYCLLSQKYWRTFLQTFCPCIKGPITRLHSVYQHTMYSTVDNSTPCSTRKETVRAIGLRRTYSSNLGPDDAVLRKDSYVDMSALKPLNNTNCNNLGDDCAECATRLDQQAETTCSMNNRNSCLERLRSNENGGPPTEEIMVLSPSGGTAWSSVV